MEIVKDSVVTYAIPMADIEQIVLDKINKTYKTNHKLEDELLQIDSNSTHMIVEVQQ